MDLVELTEFIIKSIVNDEEAVSVKEFDSEDENTMVIQVVVAEDDMGRVIGKNGKCANAIRTLVFFFFFGIKCSFNFFFIII